MLGGVPYASFNRRKPKLTNHQRTEAIKRRDKDGETLRLKTAATM